MVKKDKMIKMLKYLKKQRFLLKTIQEVANHHMMVMEWLNTMMKKTLLTVNKDEKFIYVKVLTIKVDYLSLIFSTSFKLSLKYLLNLLEVLFIFNSFCPLFGHCICCLLLFKFKKFVFTS